MPLHLGFRVSAIRHQPTRGLASLVKPVNSDPKATQTHQGRHSRPIGLKGSLVGCGGLLRPLKMVSVDIAADLKPLRLSLLLVAEFRHPCQHLQPGLPLSRRAADVLICACERSTHLLKPIRGGLHASSEHRSRLEALTLSLECFGEGQHHCCLFRKPLPALSEKPDRPWEKLP